MINFLKFIAILIIIAVDITMMETWYRTFLAGGYFNHASFLSSMIVGLIVPAIVIYFSVFAIRLILKYKQ
jgi:hypothetical protein